MAFSDRVSEPSYFQDSSSANPTPIDAVVLWLTPAGVLGFVKLSDGSEAYLHIRVLESAGGHDVSEGTRLRVTVEEGPRGRQVVKVLKIGDQSLRNSAGERNATVSAAESNTQLESEGTVKWYNPEKGFGFIAPANGENDVFVYATALTRSGLSVLSEGQRVFFRPGRARRVWRFDPFA